MYFSSPSNDSAPLVVYFASYNASTHLAMMEKILETMRGKKVLQIEKSELAARAVIDKEVQIDEHGVRSVWSGTIPLAPNSHWVLPERSEKNKKRVSRSMNQPPLHVFHFVDRFLDDFEEYSPTVRTALIQDGRYCRQPEVGLNS